MTRSHKPSIKETLSPPSSTTLSAMTPAHFEKELADLKSKASTDYPILAIFSSALPYLRTLIFSLLMGLSSALSLHVLSPSFGGIPSSIHHLQVTAAACFVGWASAHIIGQAVPKGNIPALLPLVAFYVPVVQVYLPTYAAPLNAEWAPVAVQSVSLFPLLVLSAASIARDLEGSSVRFFPSWLGDSLPGLLTFAIFRVTETWAINGVPALLGNGGIIYSRVGLQLVAAACYAVLTPTKLLFWAIPAILHAGVLNTQLPTALATAMLQRKYVEAGFKLLERKESLTGYISVFENTEVGFRALRCDHSLLGGEWVNEHSQGIVAEPIYSVFVMLEAVRLVVTKTPIPDKDAKALVIGLGIGTTPGAFAAHGINTTVVEIDPVVYEFATKYFNLPPSVYPILTDAIAYTSALSQSSPESFDYIVHDVFTGGAEPVSLFTLEFLQGLHNLLKPEGVIAINYAGDFLLPPSKAVFKTVKAIFPSCRVFRESERMTKEQIAEQKQDFSNIVIFCRKTAEPVEFQAPVSRDFLKTHTRRMVFPPRHEVVEGDYHVEREVNMVRQNDTSELEAFREISSVGHWKIMRDVINPWVWMNW